MKRSFGISRIRLRNRLPSKNILKLFAKDLEKKATRFSQIRQKHKWRKHYQPCNGFRLEHHIKKPGGLTFRGKWIRIYTDCGYGWCHGKLDEDVRDTIEKELGWRGELWERRYMEAYSIDLKTTPDYWDWEEWNDEGRKIAEALQKLLSKYKRYRVIYIKRTDFL